MTFELWLFAIKHLGQTYDAALAICNTFPEDRKEELSYYLFLYFITVPVLKDGRSSIMKWTKLLIVSDSHGEFANLRGAVMKERPFDILVHCGDVGGNLVKILEAESSFAIKAVKGNTDSFYPLPTDEDFKVEQYNIWVTHGDRYNVKYDYDLASLKAASKKHCADIILFGHSHHAEIQKDENKGLLLINPGCIGIPRTNAEVSSYAILRISDDYDIEYELKKIGGE